MTNDDPYFGARIVACVPQDRALIDRMNAQLGPGVPPWKPSIEHSPATCTDCGRAVWIGPKQKELADNVFVRTVVLCMPCINKAQDALGVETDIIGLNPDAEKIPRRY